MPSSVCYLCGASFPKQFNLNRHITLVHHSENLTPQKCDLCHYEGLPQNLIQHIRNVHEEEEGNCEMCEKSFKTKRSLKRHIKINHDFTEIFQCPICYKSFNRPDTFRGNQ